MRRFIYSALGVVFAMTAMAADISKIECTFRGEGFEGGKSNLVSCAMTPNEVFSTNIKPQAPSQMCSQKPNDFQENLENYLVDLQTKTVSYNYVMKTSEFAKEDYIQSSISKGFSREKAAEEADKTLNVPYTNRINSVDIGSREIFFKITGGIYDPPKQIPTYIIRYGENTLHYTVGVPEAVIVTPTGDERYSWVGMRFGLCESH